MKIHILDISTFFNLSRVMTFYSLLENLIRQKQTNINTNNYVQYMTSQKTETSQLATQILIRNIIHLSALHIYIEGVAQLLSTLQKHTTCFYPLKNMDKYFCLRHNYKLLKTMTIRLYWLYFILVMAQWKI